MTSEEHRVNQEGGTWSQDERVRHNTSIHQAEYALGKLRDHQETIGLRAALGGPQGELWHASVRVEDTPGYFWRSLKDWNKVREDAAKRGKQVGAWPDRQRLMKWILGAVEGCWARGAHDSLLDGRGEGARANGGTGGAEEGASGNG